MATYQFSALADGQAITFNANADVLRFDQAAIAAADIRVTASGGNTRIEVVSGAHAGKDILLLGFTPLQVTTGNLSFADGSRVFYGDNTTGTTNDNSANTRFGTGFDDLLNGFGGADTLNGGGGDDVYFVSTGDVINEVSGVDTVYSDVSWTLGAGLENLTLVGTAGLDGTGNALNNVLTGGAGDDGLYTGDGADTAAGGAGNDVLYGFIDEGFFVQDDGAADHLDGGDGNDALYGGGGDDVLIGGAGNDVLDAGWGANTLDGGLGDDTFHVYSPQDQAVDAGGIDTVIAVASDWTLAAGFEHLTVVRESFEHGSAGDRILAGSNLSNRIVATHARSAGIQGFGGNDTIFGAAGSQFGGGEEALNWIDGGDGNDSIEGASGSDELLGGAGNDYLNAFFHADLLDGGLGNDTLLGGGDRGVEGLPENDVFRFSVAAGAANADTIVDFVSGEDEIRLDANAMPALGTSGRFAAADARFYAAPGAAGGNDADDRVIYNTSTGQLFYDSDGSGSAIAQLIATLQGGATLVATDIAVQNGTAPVTTITGTAGDDSLSGTPGNDTIDGLGGHDTINGGGGADVLFGGSGNDSLFGGAGDDHPSGDDPGDRFVGGDGNDTLNGWQHALSITIDTMDGGLGNDRYEVDNPGDQLIDAGGIDIVVAIEIDWTLGAGFENFHSDTSVGEGNATGIGNELANVMSLGYGGGRLEGRGGDDMLYAGLRSSTLVGGDGNDLLESLPDHHVLDGGAGNDTLTGGPTFVFSAAPGEANADLITNFGGGLLRLDGSVHANAGVSGRFALNDARFVSGAGLTAGQESTHRVVYNTTTGELFHDADGSGAGAAELIATLQGAPAVEARNIVIDNGDAEGLAITGTPGDDSLLGSTGDDTIDGLAGNDTLNGGGGRDLLLGGDGNDHLIRDSGEDVFEDDYRDTLNGGLGDDVYNVYSNPSRGTNEDAVLIDAGGVDTVLATSWTLGPGFENLTLLPHDGPGHVGTGNELANLMITDSRPGLGGFGLLGLGGNDILIGGAGEDGLSGGDGDDWLESGIDAGDLFERLMGGAGRDSFVFRAPPSGRGDNIFDFASGSDKLVFDNNGFTAIGRALRFTANDARFAANASGAAADETDRVIYNTSTGDVWYDADGNGTGAAVRIAILENGAPALVATDIVVIGNVAGGQVMNGTAGNDSLTGTSGNDTINGLAGNDTLRGLDGNDVLDGGDGVDSLDGGLGDDTYIVTPSDVLVADPGGIDTLLTGTTWNFSTTSIDNATVTGTAAVNIDGNALDNVIVGNDAANNINARAGSDTITGNGGNDYFLMSMGGTTSFGIDWIDGGSGIDTVDYGANARSGMVVDLAAGTVSGGEAGGGGSATILNMEKFIAGGFADHVSGNAANNTVWGGVGNDTLLGLAGVDSLSGADGNDWVEGGTGFDTLSGGAGNDSFVFTASAGSANSDRITDFTAADQLLFENAVFTALGVTDTWAAGDGRFHAAAGATAGADANDRLVYNTTNGNLYYDADGAGGAAAQIVATLAGNPVLSASDITVI